MLKKLAVVAVLVSLASGVVVTVSGSGDYNNGKTSVVLAGSGDYNNSKTDGGDGPGHDYNN
ncbi:MAG: hypothetical protein LBN08_05195 [Lactobacillales bacterium]|jgi:hypothetical protein|nr:hypothetical protein [Lactobacillales bacterium]